MSQTQRTIVPPAGTFCVTRWDASSGQRAERYCIIHQRRFALCRRQWDLSLLPSELDKIEGKESPK